MAVVLGFGRKTDPPEHLPEQGGVGLIAGREDADPVLAAINWCIGVEKFPAKLEGLPACGGSGDDPEGASVRRGRATPRRGGIFGGKKPAAQFS